jgi:hypothetical protein
MRYLISIIFLLLSIPFCLGVTVQDLDGNYLTGYPDISLAKMQDDGFYYHKLYIDFYNNDGTDKTGKIGIDFKDCMIPESTIYSIVTESGIKKLAEIAQPTEYITMTKHYSEKGFESQTDDYKYYSEITALAKNITTVRFDIKTECPELKYDAIFWTCAEEGCDFENADYSILLDPSIDASKINLTGACIGINTWDNCTFPYQNAASTDILYRNFTYTTNNAIVAIKDQAIYTNNGTVAVTYGDIDEPLYENDWQYFFPLDFNGYDIAGNLSKIHDCSPFVMNGSQTIQTTGALEQLTHPSVQDIYNKIFGYDNVSQDWYYQDYGSNVSNGRSDNFIGFNQGSLVNTYNYTCSLAIANISQTQTFTMGAIFYFNSSNLGIGRSVGYSYWLNGGTQVYSIIYRPFYSGMIYPQVTQNNGTALHWNNGDYIFTSVSQPLETRFLMVTNFHLQDNKMNATLYINNNIIWSGLSDNELTEMPSSFTNIAGDRKERFLLGPYGDFPIYGRIYNAFIYTGAFSNSWENMLYNRLMNKLQLSSISFDSLYVNRTIYDKNQVYSYKATQNLTKNIYNITIYDQDGALIAQNITIQKYDIVGNYDQYYTLTGGYTSSAADGTYKFKIYNSNYTPSNIYAIFNGSTGIKYIVAYLALNTTSKTIFTLKELGIEKVLEGVKIDQYKQIGGSSQLVDTKTTDVSGTAQINYFPDTTYVFTFTKAGYVDKTITLDPITSSTYTIRMSKASSVNAEPDHFGIVIDYQPRLFYEGQNSTFIFTIFNYNNTLVDYSINLSYPSGGYYNSGSNPSGQQFTLVVPIPNNLNLFDVVTLRYSYQTTVSGIKNFTVVMPIVLNGGTITTPRFQDNTYGLGIFERVVIVTFLVLLAAGLVGLVMGSMGAIVTIFVFLAYFSYIGFIPMAILWITMLVLFMLLIRGATNG